MHVNKKEILKMKNLKSGSLSQTYAIGYIILNIWLFEQFI